MLIILNSSTADIWAQRPSVIWDQLWLIFVLISSEEDLITVLSAVIPHRSCFSIPTFTHPVVVVVLRSQQSPPSRLPPWNTSTCSKHTSSCCCWSWIRDSLLNLKSQYLPHFDIRQNRDWHTPNEYFSSWIVHTGYAKRVNNTILV